MWRPMTWVRDCPGLDWDGVNFLLFTHFIIIHLLYRFISDRPCYLQLLKKYWLKVKCKVQCSHIYDSFLMVLENNNWICELKIKFLHFNRWYKWHEVGVGTCFMSVIFHIYSNKLSLPAFCHFLFSHVHTTLWLYRQKTTLLVWNLLFRCFLLLFFFLFFFYFPMMLLLCLMLLLLVWSLESWDQRGFIILVQHYFREEGQGKPSSIML